MGKPRKAFPSQGGASQAADQCSSTNGSRVSGWEVPEMRLGGVVREEDQATRVVQGCCFLQARDQTPELSPESCTGPSR